MKHEQQLRPRVEALKLIDQSSRPRASSMSASLRDDAADAGDDLPIGPPARMMRHRSIGSVQASVEVHRSTSGRNLRLRKISQTGLDAMCSPLSLTPRAPPGKRPPSGRRPRWERSGEDDDDRSDNNAKELETDEGNNGQDSIEETKRSGVSHERRSSFSISPNAIKELERVRQMEKANAMRRVDEVHEGMSVQTDVGAELEDDEDHEGNGDNHLDDDDTTQETEEQLGSMCTQQDIMSAENKPAYVFPLWNRVKKSVRLPHALVNASESSNNSSDAVKSIPDSDDGPLRRASRESESIQVAVEMVSMLHVDHSVFTLTGGDSSATDPAPLSLTKSVSPRIGSSAPSFSFETSSLPLPTHPVGLTAAPAPPPRTVNPITKWKRGELIGAGTFGKVYVGLNGETGELFALKEIEIRAMPSADTVKQMHKLGEEISLMKNLSHKHIVRYKGSHRTDKHFCIFMEYVPGGSIASMLKQFDKFGEDLIRIFTRQIVEGVVYLHSVGVVHRDIKGESRSGANVLVNEQAMSKLADFGCSKQIPQLLTMSLEESLRSIRGSIPWMAPEVVKQERHGYKADVWSIGATVVEMATAKHPWPTCTDGFSAMYAIATATDPPPPPTHLSPEAKAFLQRCFCINPDERATAQELLQHPFLAER